MHGRTAPEGLFQPGCPWWDLRVAWGEPNIKWCEATVCGWVNEPANAWSNLAYLLVALWCTRRWLATGSRSMRRFAWTLALVGGFSFAYHATNNFGTQLLDFVGMNVLAFLLVAVNLRRAGWVARAKVEQLHLGLSLAATLLVLLMRRAHLPYQLIIVAAVLVIIGTEVWVARRRPHTAYRDFWRAVALLTAGAACSALDVMGLGCEPGNHWLQGHAVWHVLSALALLFSARHHARLESEALTPGT